MHAAGRAMLCASRLPHIVRPAAERKVNMSNPLDKFNMDWFRLDGKIAMVTGANQGLGMAYAVAFAKAGADLFIPHFTEDVSEIKALIEK